MGCLKNKGLKKIETQYVQYNQSLKLNEVLERALNSVLILAVDAGDILLLNKDNGIYTNVIMVCRQIYFGSQTQEFGKVFVDVVDTKKPLFIKKLKNQRVYVRLCIGNNTFTSRHTFVSEKYYCWCYWVVSQLEQTFLPKTLIGLYQLATSHSH